ncbi:8-oxoguanine DNA glycosylase [Jatrophihabitans lederbergiae]|uniref:8-oxoguanine DNA glycosylase n=1 Tax=Jatrophihabitans lederbergiae TaxID=3075547 RepID=UPI0037C0CA4B
MPASTSAAAFRRVRDTGLLRGPERVDSRERALLHALQAPLWVDGSLRRYRFPKQRAHRLAAALDFLEAGVAPRDPLQLRDWLLDVPGVGPKTASWVVRNHLSSDEVAIIDVHIRRAGLAAGIFDARWRLPRDYGLFEDAFLGWARHGRVSPALLDACIWGVLAAAGRAATDILGTAVGPLRPVWPVTA